MIRLLPFILVPILILGALWYFRSSAAKPKLSSPTAVENQEPVEVPKNLPGATTEDRVTSLEDIIAKLASQVNNLKSAGSSTAAPANLEFRLGTIESAITDLKTRVLALETATPAPAAALSTKYPLYIPMGSGGGPWNDQSWISLAEYQVVIDPGNYAGYSGMQLEANFRLTEAAGTGSVRLYNVTDNSAISSQLDTTTTSFGTQTSAAFKLPAGQKTYTLQSKSTQNKSLFIQSARIKVNF